jgi:hypothetical protein
VRTAIVKLLIPDLLLVDLLVNKEDIRGDRRA